MRTPKLLLVLTVLVACIGCDHATKHVARSVLEGSPAVTLAGDAVRLELTSNAGAFLSLGADLPGALRRWVLIGLVPLVTALVSFYFLRARELAFGQVVGVGLLAGGGLANWFDRLLHDGAVTDFVSLGLGPLRTGVFNLADVAIFAGVALVLWAAGKPSTPTIRG